MKTIIRITITFVLLLSMYRVTKAPNIYNNITQINKLIRQQNIMDIIELTETNKNPFMINKKENAVGILQIRPIMVKEVNRILKKEYYTLNDRMDIQKSREMFIIFQNHHNNEWNIEKAARIWNGGSNGMNKHSTIKYWKKVKQLIQILWQKQ